MAGRCATAAPRRPTIGSSMSLGPAPGRADDRDARAGGSSWRRACPASTTPPTSPPRWRSADGLGLDRAKPTLTALTTAAPVPGRFEAVAVEAPFDVVVDLGVYPAGVDLALRAGPPAGRGPRRPCPGRPLRARPLGRSSYGAQNGAIAQGARRPPDPRRGELPGRAADPDPRCPRRGRPHRLRRRAGDRHRPSRGDRPRDLPGPPGRRRRPDRPRPHRSRSDRSAWRLRRPRRRRLRRRAGAPFRVACPR